MSFLYFSLRLPEDLMKKVRILSKKEKRSVNKEIEYIIERYVCEYEESHGEIEIDKPS